MNRTVRPLYAFAILVVAGIASTLVGMQSTRQERSLAQSASGSSSAASALHDSSTAGGPAAAVSGKDSQALSGEEGQSAARARYDEERDEARARTLLAYGRKSPPGASAVRKPLASTKQAAQAAAPHQGAPRPPVEALATPTPEAASEEGAERERERKEKSAGAVDLMPTPEPTECGTECVIEFPTEEPTPEPPDPTEEPPAPTDEPKPPETPVQP